MELFGYALNYKDTNLRGRTQWYVRIRWLFLLAIIIPGVLSNLLGEGLSSQVRRDMVLGMLVLGTNYVAHLLSRPKASKNYFYWLAISLIVLDILVITVLIFTKGGIESRSPILYTIPLLIASALFGQRAVYYCAALSITLYSLLITGDWLGLIHSIGAVNPELRNNGTYVLNTVSFFTSVIIIIALLADFITRQLTEQKQAMMNILADLRTAKSKTDAEKIKDDAILKSVGEGLIVIDETGLIREINPAAEKLLGEKSLDLIGKWYPKTVELLDQEGQPLDNKDRPEMETILTGTPAKTSEYSLQRGSKRIPVALTASPFMIEDHPVGVIIVLRDITHEHELEQAKDEFLALASHQLRTPATAVKQFVGMMLEGYTGKLTKEQKETLEQAYLSNERQLHIAEDLLNTAKLESGDLVLDKALVDLANLTQSVIAELKPTFASRDQTLVTDIPNISVTVNADAGRLRMVIDNLVNNASKYTPAGKKIYVSLGNSKTHVQLQVRDEGVGIPAQSMSRLFGKFSRIPNSLSTKVGGNGLGLYIAKKIVTLHKGSLTAHSQEGKGTTFVLTLPSAPANKKKS